jgi:DeoR/GlpR family transcriptional regulator of sugar metabolism
MMPPLALVRDWKSVDMVVYQSSVYVGVTWNGSVRVHESLERPLPSRPVLAPERRRIIAELVRERGSVHAADLARLIGVTGETIRRDLSALAEMGLLERTHGGAVAAGDGETSFGQRRTVRLAEKRAIARAAATLVRDGSRIILDSGTTTMSLAHELRDKRDLLVVTNALTNAMELVGNREVTIIMTGGIVRRSTFGAVGDLAVQSLQQLHVDQAFLAIRGVSADRGLTYPSFKEVAIKRSMIASADEVILLADGSKIGVESLVQVAPLAAVQRIITAGDVDPEEARRIREAGVELIIAEVQ